MAQKIRSPFQTRTENEDEVRSLGDLIDARENPSQDDAAVAEIQGDDEDLDIEEALTFPKKNRPPRTSDLVNALGIGDTTDFDADARTSTSPDDAEDEEYMTRADFVDAMNQTDPDPNTGMDADEFVGDADLERAPDISGTVTGIDRGMATHLPQDIGADGFQIEEPEAIGDPQLQVTDDEDERLLEDDPASDGGRIPVRPPNVNTRDEALDATRRIR